MVEFRNEIFVEIVFKLSDLIGCKIFPGCLRVFCFLFHTRNLLKCYFKFSRNSVPFTKPVDGTKFKRCFMWCRYYIFNPNFIFFHILRATFCFSQTRCFITLPMPSIYITSLSGHFKLKKKKRDYFGFEFDKKKKCF